MQSVVNLQLGDVVRLPSGEAHAVRSVAEIGTSIGPMAAFVVLGELELLLSVPPHPQRPIGVYLPVNPERVPLATVRMAASGSMRFWAPHLPAISGAMGEARFSVFDTRSSVEPVVVVERHPERVAFIPSTTVANSDLRVSRMPLPDEERSVDRYAARIVSPYLPAVAANPESSWTVDRR